VERPLLPPSALYLSPELLRERLNDAPRIEVWSADHARIADAHAGRPAAAAAAGGRARGPLATR
jgi:hypothetical protein